MKYFKINTREINSQEMWFPVKVVEGVWLGRREVKERVGEDRKKVSYSKVQMWSELLLFPSPAWASAFADFFPSLSWLLEILVTIQLSQLLLLPSEPACAFLPCSVFYCLTLVPCKPLSLLNFLFVVYWRQVLLPRLVLNSLIAEASLLQCLLLLSACQVPGLQACTHHPPPGSPTTRLLLSFLS